MRLIDDQPKKGMDVYEEPLGITGELEIRGGFGLKV